MKNYITFNSVTYDSGPALPGMSRSYKTINHRVFQIFQFLGGKTEIEINRVHHVIKGGELFLMIGTVPFDIKFTGKSNALRSILCYWNNNPNYWDSDKYKEEQILLETLPDIIPLNNKVKSMFDTINAIAPVITPHSTGNEYQKALMYAAASMLSIIFTSYNEVSLNSKQEKAILPTALKDGLRYIYFEASNDISIDDIAKAAFISKRQLQNLFKKHKYPPPMEMLWERRIELSMYQLKMSCSTIKEIAYQTGFKTLPYFYKKFKKITGMTPKEYINSLND